MLSQTPSSSRIRSKVDNQLALPGRSRTKIFQIGQGPECAVFRLIQLQTQLLHLGRRMLLFLFNIMVVRVADEINVVVLGHGYSKIS